VFARPIYAAFSSEADFELVAQVGVPALRALAFFQIPLAFMIIYTNALRGAGDTRHPLAYTVIGMSVRLSLGYLCGIVLQGGLLGAWVGMFADMTLRATLSGLRFAGGRWQRVRV
jgi:MATE family multidrug resistance protein